MPENQRCTRIAPIKVAAKAWVTIDVMRPEKTARLWAWLAAALLLLIVLIVIAADLGWAGRLFPWIVYVPGQDVTAHFILIGSLAMLVNLALNRRSFQIARRSVQLGSAVILLVVAIEEFSQLWISTRGFSLYDLSADILGVLILGGWGSAQLHARFSAGTNPPTPKK